MKLRLYYSWVMDRGKTTWRTSRKWHLTHFWSLICQVPLAWEKKNRFYLWSSIWERFLWLRLKKLTTPALHQFLLREFSTTEASIAVGQDIYETSLKYQENVLHVCLGPVSRTSRPLGQRGWVWGDFLLLSCSWNSLSSKPVVFWFASSHRASLLKRKYKQVC